jgi:hypothetical protein
LLVPTSEPPREFVVEVVVVLSLLRGVDPIVGR